MPSVLAGVAAGALILQLASDTAIRRAIGAILLLLIALTLLQRRRCGPSGATATVPAAPGPAAPAHAGAVPSGRGGAAASRPARLLYGSLAGLTTMVANAGGPVTSMYFLAGRYPVKAFLGTTAWFFLALNLVKLPFSIAIGLVNPTTAALAAAGAPVVVLAAMAGRSAHKRDFEVSGEWRQRTPLRRRSQHHNSEHLHRQQASNILLPKNNGRCARQTFLLTGCIRPQSPHRPIEQGQHEHIRPPFRILCKDMRGL